MRGQGFQLLPVGCIPAGRAIGDTVFGYPQLQPIVWTPVDDNCPPEVERARTSDEIAGCISFGRAYGWIDDE